MRGARVGVIRESIGLGSEPDSADYGHVAAVFDKAVIELSAAGADIVDPVVLPQLHQMLVQRAFENTAESFETWMGRSTDPPYASHADLVAEPVHGEVMWRRSGGRPPAWSGSAAGYVAAREQLATNLMVLMADLELDAIVHVTAEHSPTLIRDGVNPPYVNQKGAPHLNTFLYDVPSISVPAGFTALGLPVGLTFLGRPFSDALMVAYAYAYEQHTMHRRPPASAPPLDGEP